MTVRRRFLRRVRVMKWSRSKASVVAFWLLGSSETAARQSSEATISVFRKCFLANVDLPDEVGPTIRTMLNSGTWISIVVSPWELWSWVF